MRDDLHLSLTGVGGGGATLRVMRVRGIGKSVPRIFDQEVPVDLSGNGKKEQEDTVRRNGMSFAVSASIGDEEAHMVVAKPGT